MKKSYLLIFVAAFFAASFVNAQVDLQIQKAFSYTSYLYSPATQLFVVVQNNGPDDFEGAFEIAVTADDFGWQKTFSGSIPALGTKEIALFNSPKDIEYHLVIDPNDKIRERNESNNWFCYKADEPQIRLMSNGLIARDVFDTLYVTPGEFYDDQFVITDMNDHSSIIGVDFNMRTYDYSNQIGFSTSFTYINNIMDGYTCYVKESFEFGREMNVTLLANSSEYAASRYWLGYFWGYGESEVGKVSDIYIFAKFAQTNLQNGTDYVNRSIKTRDVVRCDINGDGVVNREDFDMLQMVVEKNLFNSFNSFGKKHRYTKKGVNYGAGRILFSQPDFLSVALLNIWLNNPNDELVKGLGIGQLMSETMPGSAASSIMPINNTFSVENGELIIEAFGADVYNVVAQTADGKMIQRTGRLGENITLPLDAKNIHVETVKIKGSTTGLFGISKTGVDVSIFPNPVTDYLQISSPESGKLSVLNLNGQEIYSSSINANEMLNLDAQTWTKGIYLVKIITATGQSTVKVAK